MNVWSVRMRESFQMCVWAFHRAIIVCTLCKMFSSSCHFPSEQKKNFFHHHHNRWSLTAVFCHSIDQQTIQLFLIIILLVSHTQKSFSTRFLDDLKLKVRNHEQNQSIGWLKYRFKIWIIRLVIWFLMDCDFNRCSVGRTRFFPWLSSSADSIGFRWCLQGRKIFRFVL